MDRVKRLIRTAHTQPFHLPVDPLAAVDQTPLFSFTESRAPEVSIVIPVFNQSEFTIRCLRSIEQTPSSCSFEIIIVDDCSHDDTPEKIQAIQNIFYLRNEENIGFIRSCNRGAQQARGKYIHFLNNDTFVMPGWLDELVSTYGDTQNVGLVGSKLLYPDGVLQEAGGIIWNDASGWNYGRGDDPLRPEYCYRRDVDYCSGASLMIPRELFWRLGGFDEHYLPAYGEDSDLAFRVRQAGYRVLYQPLSAVVHFEGVTSGKCTTQGIKRHQVVNKEKLFERWAHVLINHGAPGERPMLERERSVQRRILVVDACTPMPDQDAGSLKIFNYMQIFQDLGYKVTFVADNLSYVDEYTPALQRIGIECLYWPYTTSIRRHLKQSGALYDFILACRPDITERHLGVFRKYASQAKVLFDTGDLHFIRERRQAELENDVALARSAEKRKRQELTLASRVDCTIVVSDVEKDILLLENPALKVATISAVHAIPRHHDGFSSREDIMFLGGYQHLPNVDAVIYFVREILPLICEKLPNIRFHIVGSRAPKEVLDLAGPNVIIDGYVSDLTNLLNGCRVSVNPLRYGAGVKGKIVTALSYGLPCVGSSMAFEGMGFADGEQALVADDPNEFAGRVVQLYLDAALWERLSQKGIEIVQKDYSFATGRYRFSALFSELGVVERPAPVPKTIYGACNICGSRTHFKTLGQSHYRESLICMECGSSCRQRAIASGLLETLATASIASLNSWAAQQEGPRILDTDAYSAIFNIMRAAPFYVSSSYQPKMPVGTMLERKVINLDLMAMPFEDASFDCILTSDVMEHVRHDDRAHREIWRCLRPGGYYIFTVPYVPAWERNQIRVDTSGKEDTFPMEKQYHGDPLNKQGALVYRIYGRELLEQLQAMGFLVQFMNEPDLLRAIPVRDVFVCQKVEHSM